MIVAGVQVDATLVALIALLIFLGAMIYLKVPGMLANALDARSREIAKELHEARRLREEAEAALAAHKAKLVAAEKEAKAILDHAIEQAAAVAEETKAQIKAGIARRQKQAEDRIAQAEAKAEADVRAAAADAALAAAERMIRERMNDATQAALVNEGVADMKRKFG